MGKDSRPPIEVTEEQFLGHKPKLCERCGYQKDTYWHRPPYGNRGPGDREHHAFKLYTRPERRLVAMEKVLDNIRQVQCNLCRLSKDHIASQAQRVKGRLSWWHLWDKEHHIDWVQCGARDDVNEALTI